MRTIRVEDYSFELCGGTHCRATGQIGGFVITGERSIGSGMRRIEALTGARRGRLVRERARTLDRVAEAVGATSVDAVEDRVAALQDELRETKRRLAAAAAGLPEARRARLARRGAGAGVVILRYAAPFESMDAMKAYAKDVRGALGDGVVALALDADEPHLFVTVSRRPRRRGACRPATSCARGGRHRRQGRRPAGDGAGQGHAPRGLDRRHWLAIDGRRAT